MKNVERNNLPGPRRSLKSIATSLNNYKLRLDNLREELPRLGLDEKQTKKWYNTQADRAREIYDQIEGAIDDLLELHNAADDDGPFTEIIQKGSTDIVKGLVEASHELKKSASLTRDHFIYLRDNNKNQGAKKSEAVSATGKFMNVFAAALMLAGTLGGPSTTADALDQLNPDAQQAQPAGRQQDEDGDTQDDTSPDANRARTRTNISLRGLDPKRREEDEDELTQ